MDSSTWAPRSSRSATEVCPELRSSTSFARTLAFPVGFEARGFEPPRPARWRTGYQPTTADAVSYTSQ